MSLIGCLPATNVTRPMLWWRKTTLNFHQMCCMCSRYSARAATHNSHNNIRNSRWMNWAREQKCAYNLIIMEFMVFPLFLFLLADEISHVIFFGWKKNLFLTFEDFCYQYEMLVTVDLHNEFLAFYLTLVNIFKDID